MHPRKSFRERAWRVRQRAYAEKAVAVGWLDARRLRRAAPNLVPTSTELESSRAELFEAYLCYTETVSPRDMAASLETACLLLYLCRACGASSVLDTGSGFSSFVLRTYARAADRGVEVVSVDDNQEWLDRTSDFLDEFNLPHGELVNWEDFALRTPKHFNLVFHDLAGGELRENAMSHVTANVGPGGVIVFDDAQHSGHRRCMHRVTNQAGLGLFSLRRWTLDEVGRYAMLGVSKS